MNGNKNKGHGHEAFVRIVGGAVAFMAVVHLMLKLGWDKI